MDITVNNNDVLRRVRYTFNFNDKQMVALFASAGVEVSREQISQWLKKDSDSDFVGLYDTQLAVFLNGFINEKRGKKPGPHAVPEKRLTNNIILMKLKIALNLQAEGVIELLNDVGFTLGKSELSAFSRKVDHQHYRECKDQVLRNFLQAIDQAYHVERTGKIDKPANSSPKPSHNMSSNTKGNFKKKIPGKAVIAEPYVEGARPNASNIYINPKSTTTTTRNKLKLNKGS